MFHIVLSEVFQVLVFFSRWRKHITCRSQMFRTWKDNECTKLKQHANLIVVASERLKCERRSLDKRNRTKSWTINRTKKRTHCTKVRQKTYPICRRFTFEFGTAERCTVTKIAPPKSLLCVNPIRLVFYQPFLVSSRNVPPLRDDTKNGCVADYYPVWFRDGAKAILYSVNIA